MNELVAGTFAVIIAAVTAYGSFRLGRRLTSGSVDTSTAETLWHESSVMREELRAEVVSLRAEVVALRADSVQRQAEVEVLRAEAKQAKDHAARCDRQLAALRKKIDELSDQQRP